MTLLEPDVRECLDGAERDLMAHITMVGPEMHFQARVHGFPISALCGKVWIPSRDPDRYPVCPTCIETFEYRVGPWPGRR